MTIALYMDVHIPQSMTIQLRRRNIDIITAQEDNTIELSDDQLLERSTELGRVVFTQDIRFRALAENWQREGKPFGGLIFGHQLAQSDNSLKTSNSSPKPPTPKTGRTWSNTCHFDFRSPCPSPPRRTPHPYHSRSHSPSLSARHRDPPPPGKSLPPRR
jgi:Domain of unknown function (DUF5615)